MYDYTEPINHLYSASTAVAASNQMTIKPCEDVRSFLQYNNCIITPNSIQHNIDSSPHTTHPHNRTIHVYVKADRISTVFTSASRPHIRCCTIAASPVSDRCVSFVAVFFLCDRLDFRRLFDYTNATTVDNRNETIIISLAESTLFLIAIVVYHCPRLSPSLFYYAHVFFFFLIILIFLPSVPTRLIGV